jgi:ribosomal protein S18 acetylase RimI-like enzyme
MSGVEIAVVGASATDADIDGLAAVLEDCVAGGASVNFMHPYSRDDAAAFFRKVIASVAQGDIILLAASLDGRIVGAVQLGLDTPPNQPHRAEIRKLLVHRDARRQGIGEALMQHAERVAKQLGRTLLVLDTASDAAERLYTRTGWQRLGTIPDYALWPGGGYCGSTIFWKKLG